MPCPVIPISIHTPARGVTADRIDDNSSFLISIHTPARGVTVRDNRREFRDFISIHTPARGVTLTALFCAAANSYFNPHSRTGSDSLYSGNEIREFISIHTPARGVTCCGPCRPGICHISIHTPARGVTLALIKSSALAGFQSTLPHGE